jgi:hypothetical protein
MTFSPEELLALYNSSKEELIQQIVKLQGERNLYFNELIQAKGKLNRLQNIEAALEVGPALDRYFELDSTPGKGRFYMLYAEGGQTPAIKHKKKRIAVKVAVNLAARLDCKVYVLTAKGFIAPPKVDRPVEEVADAEV